MITDIVIRKALTRDVDALIQLLNLLFEIETDFLVDELKQRHGLEMLLREENRGCLMVAELQREIVGMCSAQLLVSTAEGGLKAIIEDVVIAEGYRGHKVGSRLLAAVESWALSQGAKRLDLLADRDNTPALGFYEKMNWHATKMICLQKKL